MQLAGRHTNQASPLQLTFPLVFLTLLLIAGVLRFLWLDRYPPGWHHDEALMGVMAGEVYRGEERPIFFRQYLGQEPLYIYLSAGMMALLGGNQDILPLRLTSAATGLLTVLLTYLLGARLFDRRTGLIAMALIGTSFWQVMSSRNGYRSITQPLLEALAVYLFWCARKRGGLGWYAASGAALGGSWYTYLGARAFPAVFLAFGLWLLLRGARPTYRDVVRVSILALVGALVVAPLAIFFFQNPGTFSARMEQVFIFRPEVSGGHPWAMLADNTLKMLRSFTISGEPMWRYNIPGRPMFVGGAAVAFYIGVLVLLRRLRQRDDAAAMVMIWLAVMFFPGLLSWDVGAYTLRAMGLVPALYLVPAAGINWAWEQISARRAWGRIAATVATAALILIDAGWTARDYFIVWSSSFGAWWEDHADSVAQARFLVQAARPATEDIFVGNEYYHHPTLAQLARPVYPALRWFDGRQSVVFSPDENRPALYVLAFSGLPAEVDRLFPRTALIGEKDFPVGIDGGRPPPLFLAYRLTPGEIRAQVERLKDDPRLHRVDGEIASYVQPLGAEIDGPVQPGHDLTADLLWRVNRPLPPGEYQMFAQLVDQQWHEITDVEGLGYPPPEWRAGDVVWSHFVLPVPTGTAPGLYRVQIALYDRTTGARIAVRGGQPGINALILGSVRVISPRPPPPPAQALSARLGTDIRLIGVDPPSVSPTGDLTVTLHWTADRPVDRDFTVFVQLLGPDGRLVAQSDSWPANGALPTSSWLPGEVVLDQHHLRPPPMLPAGSYDLIAGMYLLATGQRLPVSTGGDFVRLGSIVLPAPSNGAEAQR
ncbi:MAG TPA: glycosyltransferase family 39 protein [Chloroflexota bacterium]|nr:glycosyltransferase family 39 protein [Chloroflexota bacterium]